MLRHSPRAFVERLDFTTSLGDNLRVVITDLGILERRDGELTLVAIHPGVEVEDVARGDRLGSPGRRRPAARPSRRATTSSTALRALKTKGHD